ncbi:hypothetical protein RABR111495_19060 [Rahnella bruchi]|uniref:winged helix-turn-helix domain-containing protein n=1 Tax=Rahnella bruchi TaxID=1510573 RepID=UPI000EA1C63A|nr:hypothetical protein [Rahnella bruchi]
MMKVIINDIIEYDPDAGMLINITSGDSVEIPQPAIFLLNVFVRNSRIIISRNSLMEEAWESNGLTVSGSNLSNYLGVIRRAFITLHQGDEIIKTMPRVGITFSARVLIEDQRQPAAAAVSEPADQPAVSEPADQPAGELPAEVAALKVTTAAYNAAVATATLRSTTNRNIARIKPLYLFTAAVLVTLLLPLTYFDRYQPLNNVDVRLWQIGRVGQCTLFIFHQPDEEEIAYGNATLERLLKKHQVSCNSQKYNVYYAFTNGQTKMIYDRRELVSFCRLFSDESKSSCENYSTSS